MIYMEIDDSFEYSRYSAWYLVCLGRNIVHVCDCYCIKNAVVVLCIVCCGVGEKMR